MSNHPISGEGPAGTTIGFLQPGQLDAAVELFDAQLKEHGIETGLEKVREALAQIASDPRHGFVLAAEDAEKTLAGVALCSAFLGVEHGGPSGWLEELYVRPEARAKGLGTQLLTAAIREATRRGWRALELEVESDHRRVIPLYERHGFELRTRARYWLKIEQD